MELRNYINILWRRKLTILLTLITTMIIVVIGTKKITPVYEASSILRIATSSSGSTSTLDYMYADRLMNTYVKIATSRPVNEEVMQELGLRERPKIKAEIIPSTELIKITVKDNDPSRAATIANTLADVLIAQSSQLYIGGGKKLTDVLGQELTTVQEDLEKAQHEYEIMLAQTPVPDTLETVRQLLDIKQRNYATLLGQYEQAKFREEIQSSMITVFEMAMVPETPVEPRVALNIGLAFIIGLVGGVALAFVFENLDTTLYDVDDIEAVTNLPALVQIPKANKSQINTFQEKFSALDEVFRNLATNIQLVNHKVPKKVLLLLSAEPNQGKSMITCHLACSLAELGNNIVVVDCDTRIPKIHNFFKLSNQAGLKDVLEQAVCLEDALQATSFDRIHVLTSGSQLAHPAQMLGSVQMGKLVKKLSQQFDYVLLDSPAMLAVADVAPLAPIADGLILVVRRAHAQREAVQAVSNFLARQNCKFTSLIVNQADHPSHYYYYKDRKKREPLLGLVRRISRKRNKSS